MKLQLCPLCNEAKAWVTESSGTGSAEILCTSCRTFSGIHGDVKRACIAWNNSPRLFDIVGPVSLGSPYLPLTLGGIAVAFESLKSPIPYDSEYVVELARQNEVHATAAMLVRAASYFATLGAASLFEMILDSIGVSNAAGISISAEDERRGLAHSLWLRSELLLDDRIAKLRRLKFNVDIVNFNVGPPQEKIKWTPVPDPF